MDNSRNGLVEDASTHDQVYFTHGECSSDGNENSPYWHLGPLKPSGHWHIRSPLSAHFPPLKHVLALHTPADTTYKDVDDLNVV